MAAVGMPNLPGLTVQRSPVNPVLDYDFGPGFVKQRYVRRDSAASRRGSSR